MGDAEDIAHSGGREGAPRMVLRSGRHVAYGWRPHPRGGSEVYLVSSDATLLWGLTTVQGEEIARLLMAAWASGHDAGRDAGLDAAAGAVDRLRRLLAEDAGDDD